MLGSARHEQDPSLLPVYDLLGEFPEFPQPGVRFVDIFPIFRSVDATTTVIDRFAEYLKDKSVDVIVGLEARGFLFAPLVAVRLGISFVPIRKEGKLPGACYKAIYEKEYGPDTFELQKDSIQVGARVAIMDDVFSTGGTAAAAERLIRMAGATVVADVFIIQGKNSNDAGVLQAPTYSLFSV
ncbi:adenine phosphoribosyltransferase [Zychaea mexicana]|uniref:adenine phosphoribosyltransferase n=1 Tax=Zychaea mexicana TaxID=64656 RepID=UPI0022FEF788|nr:adenine phosphoribosyltransferase [Zychaea mexicana]KAI9493452.1 adenine phosphoribosyltransferase [Zychaea mexicana]